MKTKDDEIDDIRLVYDARIALIRDAAKRLGEGQRNKAVESVLSKLPQELSAADRELSATELITAADKQIRVISTPIEQTKVEP